MKAAFRICFQEESTETQKPATKRTLSNDIKHFVKICPIFTHVAKLNCFAIDKEEQRGFF